MARLRLIAGLAAMAAASVSSAEAQQGKAALYAFHTDSVEGCPGLDWHVVVQPDGALGGFVAWDQMKHMATLTGSVGKDGSFDMKAREVGEAGRQATVTGKAAGDYITAAINGSGTACDEKPLNIPRVEGGTQGGGG